MKQEFEIEMDNPVFLLILIKMAIETPDKLSDSDLDAIISVWNRKPRRIVV